MTLSNYVRTLTILVFPACGLASQDVRVPGAADVSPGAVAAARAPAEQDARLITEAAMGPVRLRMTLDEARRALPTASFTRTSDGDGAALVDVGFPDGESLVLWADEDDPESPVDWSKKIVTIETFSATFHTRDGTRPGSLVRDVIRRFGPVQKIVESEIESRQFITFARQPEGVTFRLDYTGIFPPGTRRTTRFEPGAKILSIAVSSSH